MSMNINEQNKDYGTSDCHGHTTAIRNTRPTLSLLNPDDIPPIRRDQTSRYDRKPDVVAAQLPEPNTDIHYVSSSTSSSDSGLEVSTSSNTSESTDIDTTQYSSSQLHYYRNREKILAYAKLRYKNNRDSLLAYSKKYQSERKDIVKDRNVTYYEANRERLLKDRAKKITCECGKVIAKGSLSNHLHTAYHLRRVAVTTNRDDIPPPPELNNA